MSDEPKDKKEVLRNVLSEALDLAENRFTFANNVQLYFGGNEVTLDFYYLGPSSKPNVYEPKAQRLYRVVLPVAVAKEMAQLIVNYIRQWEDAHGITLPLDQERLFEPNDMKNNE